MTDHQLKLLKNGDIHHRQNGPVFEFGPGWGAKTKKWFKKYILASDCTLCRNTRYILLIGLIVVILGGSRLRKLVGIPQNPALIGQIKIAEFVQPGDSKIRLARRMLASYLAQSPNTTLTNGQKVFIETILGQKIDNDVFHAGANIEFTPDDIQSAIIQSRALSPSQLQYWEEASRNVRF